MKIKSSIISVDNIHLPSTKCCRGANLILFYTPMSFVNGAGTPHSYLILTGYVDMGWLWDP